MAHSKLYVKLMNSREWRALRMQVIAEQPLCQHCLREGRLQVSQCVHHVIPIESGRTEADCRELAFKRTNCVALCYQCHADIHKAERSYTKEVIKERSKQRVEAWADGLKKRFEPKK